MRNLLPSFALVLGVTFVPVTAEARAGFLPGEAAAEAGLPQRTPEQIALERQKRIEARKMRREARLQRREQRAAARASN